MCQSISWLHVDTSRCNYLVPCLWHDSQCLFWCVVHLCTKSSLPCWWLLLPRQYPTRWRSNKLNGAIHIACTILKLVAASAAEAELGALFLNAQEAEVLWLILTELGHPEPPTPIHIDNTTTVGIVNNRIKQQRSQAMEMRYFWLLDGETQQYFKFYYQPGHEKLGDYPSKHHTANIHQHIRPYYVHMNNSPTLLPRAWSQALIEGVLKSLGIPTPRNPHYQALVISLIWPTPLKLSSYQVLGQSRIQQRHITRYNHPRIEAQ